MLKCVVILAICTVAASAQPIDLRLDFQTNAVVQLERAFDGTLWGITASSMDRLPTLAGVYTVRSTDMGQTWDTSCVTPDWWRWGVQIAPQSANTAWAFVLRDDVTDTLECYRTTTGGASWVRIEPIDVGLARLFDVQFFSETVGVAIGSTGRAVTSKWVVSRTTDGGRTWTLGRDMQAFLNEQIAQRNGRSISRNGGSLAVGMTTGRLLITSDSGASWSFAITPIRGPISAVTHTANGDLLAVQTSSTGNSTAHRSADGSSWTLQALPVGLNNVRGLRLLKDGALATIPNDVEASGLSVITADLQRASSLKNSGCFGVIELPDGQLLTGTETVPRGGLLRLARP